MYVSDRICLEHGLSVIDPNEKREKKKRTVYPKHPTFRGQIRADIDRILKEQPTDFEEFLRKMEAAGYEIKRGKQIAVRGNGQQRFLRFRSLGEGYTEDDVRDRIAGKKDRSSQIPEKRPFNLLIDIQQRMQQGGKGAGYERWAKVYNLKQMSETFLFMREHHIENIEDLYEKTEEAVSRFQQLNDQIKTAESRMAENLALQKNIQNYAKTREIYQDYRRSGYSKRFFEAHRADLTLHQAAKAAFQSLGRKKLPAIRELRQEYAELITKKKGMYQEYRKAKKEMRDYLTTRQNVEQFYGEDLKKEREEAKRQQVL